MCNTSARVRPLLQNPFSECYRSRPVCSPKRRQCNHSAAFARRNSADAITVKSSATSAIQAIPAVPERTGGYSRPQRGVLAETNDWVIK